MHHGARTQTCVGGEWFVLGEPLRKGTQTEAYAETLGDTRGNALSRLTAVVETETLKDDLEREGFAFGNLRGEDAVAIMAAPALDDFMLFIALAFPCDARTLAVDAALKVRADERPARMRWRTG